MLRLTNSKNDEVGNVNFKNVIGRNSVASYFARNGYALMTCELQDIMEMNTCDGLYTVAEFRFPNNKDFIRVESM